MIYIEESFQFKKMRKFGKEEMRIVKDYRNLEVCVKEREGCRKPVADPDMVGEIEGQPVGTRYMDRMSALEAGVHGSLRRGIYSYKGSPRSVVFQMGTKSLYNKDKGNRIRFGEGGRSKDGTMQVKDQVYTHGNRALQNAMQSGQSVHVIRGYRLHSKYAPNNGFRYDGLYKVMACYQKRDKNGYKIILFKLERLPDQLSIGTRGKFWVYLPMPEPAKVSEPSAPMQSLFSTRPELPSFNKFKTSSYTLPANWQQVALNQSCPTHLNSDSGAPLSPVPPVKVKNYCDGTLRYPAKVESTVIAAIPLLQYPEVDIKVGGTHSSAKPSLHAESHLPRTLPYARASKPSPRHPSVFLIVVLRRASLAIWRIAKDGISIFLPHLCSPFMVVYFFVCYKPMIVLFLRLC